MPDSRYASFLRFCIVGAVCTALDAAIFYLMRSYVPYRIALVTGYVLSLVVNYFLTVYWTFKSSPTVRNAIGIVAAHLFNLFIVRMGLMYLFVDLIGMSDSIAYLPTLVISVVTNFVIVKFVVEKSSRQI